jgi:hypothetical protein
MCGQRCPLGELLEPFAPLAPVDPLDPLPAFAELEDGAL